MPELPTYVLDSFALLAYLADEPAAERVENIIQTAQEQKNRLILSIINVGELLYITERRGNLQRAQDVLALIRQLPIEILPADEQTVFSAAHIKANHALSYADAFVVAVAQRETGIILTGDPEFQTVEDLVTIEWLEKKT
ncbi:MAG: type II toxin-antitoxin system VapC family toxin [Gammaproteobacteria bacterium]|nr:type II toxin-antitoxin system VapC family toxin [Gammaproteobacteria bacterium]